MSVETLLPPSQPESDLRLQDMELGRFTVPGQVELVTNYTDEQRFEARASELRRPPHYTPATVADEFDLLSEQAEAAIANGEAMLPRLRVAMRMPRHAFEALLAGEPYKTAYEGMPSRGGGPHVETREYLYNRARQEKAMGFRSSAEDESITYGFLTDGSEYRSTARPYGPMSVILKEGTIARSTFTRGDSLRPWKEAPELLGIEEAAIAHEALEIKRYTYTADNPATDSYVEAQILGGVSLDDVESVVLDMGLDHFGSKFSADQEAGWLDERAVEQAIEQIEASGRGIPITVRVPATEGMSSDFIEIARRHPSAEFIALINVTDYDRYAALPYETTFLSDLISKTLNGESDARETTRVSKLAYDTAKTRQTELKANLVEFWKSQGRLAEDFPKNIRVIVTGRQ